MRYRWCKAGQNQEDLMVFDRQDGVLHFLQGWSGAGVTIPDGARQDELEGGAQVASQIILHASALHLSRGKVNELNQAFNDVVFLGSNWPGSKPSEPEPPPEPAPAPPPGPA